MHLYDHKAFLILSSFVFLGQAYFLKKKFGTFIFPACLISLAWFFYTIIPLLASFNTPATLSPILYIFSCTFFFSLSSLPFNWKLAFKTHEIISKDKANFLQGFTITFSFYSSIILSIIFTTLFMIYSGYTITEIVYDLRSVSSDFVRSRVSGRIEYNFMGVLSTFFTYLTPALGGLIVNRQKKRYLQFLLVFLSFVPSFYLMALQSLKLAVFYSCGLLLGSVLLSRIHNRNFFVFDKNLILSFLIGIPISAPFFLFAFSTRNEYVELIDIIGSAYNLFKSYAFGQFYAFCDFFNSITTGQSIGTYQHDLNSYGAYTFTSLYNFIMPDKHLPIGTFYDFFNYKNQLHTNIFTIFRGLINDFGLVGTLIYMFISGLVAHGAYWLLLVKKSLIADSFFILFVVYVQGTYLASIFMSRHMYLLCAALVVILSINKFVIYKKQKNKNV